MLEVQTSSRLHFGLVELAADAPHRFGGLGLMVKQPGLRVRLLAADSMAEPHAETTSERFIAPIGEWSDRIGRAIDAASAMLSVSPLAVGQFRITTDICLHAGLGTGTQLACAVATAVRLSSIGGQSSVPPSDGRQWKVIWDRTTDRDDGHASIRELAQLSARGKRSAIGLHGFVRGGLILDRGRGNGDDTQCESSRPIDTDSVSFPDAWRVVLLLADASPDHSSHRASADFGAVQGETEERLIVNAGRIANPHRRRMLDLADACIVGAAQAEFDAFTRALGEYMTYAGEMFREVQSGLYRTEEIASAVAAAQSAGLAAVGQSSWGPTVFGFARNESEAAEAVQFLSNSSIVSGRHIVVTEACNHGALHRSLTLVS